MAIEVVPPELDGQNRIEQALKSSPYEAAWWTAQTVTNIPKDAIGWLVSQGWRITGITFDTTVVPKEPYFSMARQSLQNGNILQSLLNDWTTAWNEAASANTFRYNDVVSAWSSMINSTHVQFERQVEVHNTYVTLFLGNLTTYMDEVDTLIDANTSQLTTDAVVATTALTEMDSRLSDLEDNANNNATIIDGLLGDQATYLSTFLADLVIKLAELDANYSAHLVELESLLATATTDLATFTTTQAANLSSIEAAYAAHTTELDELLTAANEHLATVTDDINAVLVAAANDYTELDNDISALLAQGTNALGTYATDYSSLVAKLETDYNIHVPVATAFLDNLGATDLARINEEFVASRSVQLQQLTDRGLYSGGVAVDVTARNTRDRDEQVQMLNDRLMREQFENQHRLYGQQVAMRTGTMNGTDRVHSVRQEIWRYQASQITGLYQSLQGLRDRTQSGKQTIYALRDANTRLNIEVQTRMYEAGQTVRRLLVEEAARLQQLQQGLTQWKASQRDTLYLQVQQVVSQHVASIAAQHDAQQNVSRSAEASRNTLLTQLQAALGAFLTGKERYASMTMQNASILAEHKHRAIVEKMNEAAVRLQGLASTNEEDMKLMAYQLDERNGLLKGIYGFVERREDTYPSFNDLATLCTSLGDSGGGWLVP